jgi:hypothetical protein
MDWAEKRGLPHHRTFGGRLRFDPEAVIEFCKEKNHPIPESLAKHVERENTPGPKRKPATRTGPGLVGGKVKAKRRA